MNALENTKTSAYVIDDAFRIIYSNDELQKSISDKQRSAYCYEVIGGEHGQCKSCPLRTENAGRSIRFDKLRNQWIHATAAPMQIPGIGPCHVILTERMEERGKSDFCSTEGKADYDALPESNDVPVRKSAEHAAVVNNFYNLIDAPCAAAEKDAFYRKNEFFRRTEEILASSGDDAAWCMIAIDIEKLKLFNEWYGRSAGDALLKDLFDCIKSFQEQQGGIAGYFENDDFALLVPNDENQIRTFYQKTLSVMRSHGDKINVLPAMGVCEVANKGSSAFQVYDRANLACTAVKGNYRSRIKKFDREMLDRLESEYLLFSDIQKAFENREFAFVLQPKCNMRNGRIIGAEALARWNSKEKGEISPAVFIPFLEKSGYIAELDTYIWEEVCKWLRRMLDRGIYALPVSVNVSRADLYAVNVPAYFEALIQKYGLSSALIEIEITESAYIEDNGFVNQNIERLRQSGFRVLMDDFGSAYSSLNMLKDIAVDTLKIDMRFLNMNDVNRSKGLDILETVCNMAGILGLDIIVEGVETEEHRNYLLNMRCDYGQGYYFYRPLSIEDFEKKLEQYEKKT